MEIKIGMHVLVVLILYLFCIPSIGLAAAKEPLSTIPEQDNEYHFVAGFETGYLKTAFLISLLPSGRLVVFGYDESNTCLGEVYNISDKDSVLLQRLQFPPDADVSIHKVHECKDPDTARMNVIVEEKEYKYYYFNDRGLQPPAGMLSIINGVLIDKRKFDSYYSSSLVGVVKLAQLFPTKDHKLTSNFGAMSGHMNRAITTYHEINNQLFCVHYEHPQGIFITRWKKDKTSSIKR